MTYRKYFISSGEPPGPLPLPSHTTVSKPRTHSLRRFSPLVDAISPHELEVWMLFVYNLDAYIAPVSHTCVPAWRNAQIYTNIMYLLYMCPTKNNIQCLASRVCRDISSLPFCAAHICTLHLAELLSMCVLTQPLDCSICHPLCIWCASLAFHVLLFHILIYIYINICVCSCVCVFVSLLLYWVNFCARHLPCVWNMLINTYEALCYFAFGYLMVPAYSQCCELHHSKGVECSKNILRINAAPC